MMGGIGETLRNDGGYRRQDSSEKARLQVPGGVRGSWGMFLAKGRSAATGRRRGGRDHRTVRIVGGGIEPVGGPSFSTIDVHTERSS